MVVPAASERSAQLTELELAAWVGLLRAHAKVTRALDDELERECGLSLPQYEVLLQLGRAPERRLRMTDLAQHVLLSRSGLTRLVDRLEAAGLVTRQSCPSDLRGTFAVLTRPGLARLRVASDVHLRGVRAHVTSRLSDEDQRALAHATAKLLDGR